MEISRRTDYAIRLITAMLKNDGKPLSVHTAATLQDIPYSFARSIQHELTKSGLIETVRGSRGGMVLAVDPNELTLTELIETIQGPLSFAVCLSEEGWCTREEHCVFHSVWGETSALVRSYLSSVTIRDLLKGEKPALNALKSAR